MDIEFKQWHEPPVKLHRFLYFTCTYQFINRHCFVRKCANQSRYPSMSTEQQFLKGECVNTTKYLQPVAKAIDHPCNIGNIPCRFFYCLDVIVIEQFFKHIKCYVYLVINRI